MKFGLRDVSKTIISKTIISKTMVDERTEAVPGDKAEPALPGSSLASSASDFTAPEGVARSPRQRLWAPDVACYYAQRWFNQTGRATDRLIWESCQQERQKARARVK